MKACKTYEQDLLLLAHGQLSASDAARVRKHLTLCPPCEARLTQLAGVSLLLADAVHFAPAAPVVSSPPHSSFLPAKQQWLLSAFLGGCILFALLSLVRTAQSYASPVPALSAGTYAAIDDCAIPTQGRAASPAAMKATPCPKRGRSLAVPLSPLPPRKP